MSASRSVHHILKYFRNVRLKTLQIFLVLAVLVMNILFLYSVLSYDNKSKYKHLKQMEDSYFVKKTFSDDKLTQFSLEDLDSVKVEVDVQVPDAITTQCVGQTWNKPSMDIKETYQWQNIANGLRDAFVFSAFYDPRTNPNSIRIIALAGGYFSNNERSIKYCQMWFTESTKPLIVKAEYVVLPDSHGRSYGAAFYNCFLKSNHKFIPYALSLVQEPCHIPVHVLKVVVNDQHKLPDVDFSICVSPLNCNYDNVHQLVEMIEVNRLFGAGRFIFYNYSMSNRVQNYLEVYIKEGVATVIPWQLPVTTNPCPPDPKVMPQVHYFAQLSALNDCVYREMFRARFVVLTDLDEIIVPTVRDRWRDMMNDAYVTWMKDLQFSNDHRNTDQFILPGAFMFRNAFFYTDWENDPILSNNQTILSLQLNTLLKTTRDSTLNMFYDRSKCIVWTKGVALVSVHHVLEFIDGARTMHVQVNEDFALLHHYRHTMDEENYIQVLNRRMQNFSKQIISVVNERHRIGLV